MMSMDIGGRETCATSITGSSSSRIEQVRTRALPSPPLLLSPADAGEGASTGTFYSRSPLRRVEHDLALHLAALHQPVRVGGARERQQALDLRLDLAVGG